MANESMTTEQDALIREITEGLSQPQKRLPSKLFYDEKGSRLFDRICELEEYYPTRTEMKIMNDNIDEIVDVFQHPATLFVEFGSGSSMKTRLLLDHLDHLAGYVPVDISEEHLLNSAALIRKEYPELKVYPLVADFTKHFNLPAVEGELSDVITWFPGSTIGNFSKEEAAHFIEDIHTITGDHSGMLIGVDLVKDKQVLEAAYNDSEGVTAAFNMNMLFRLNKEFGAGFDTRLFRHYAFFNEEESRIEMHLVSLADQEAEIGGRKFFFNEGETILTEYSNKYTFESFAAICSGAYTVEHVWTDEESLFSVQFLAAKP